MKISWDQCRPERLRRHWNGVASLAADSFRDAPSTQYYRRREIYLFEQYFAPLKGKRLLKLDLWNEIYNTGILEWACGAGAEVYGMDISDVVTGGAIRSFRKKSLIARFVVDDIRSLCFKDETFDYLYTMGTIEHIPDYERAVREIHRVLAKDGVAVVGVPNKFDPFLRPLVVAALDLVQRYPYSPEKAFSARELRELLASNGFRILDRTGILFMPGLLRMIDIALFRVNPRWCGLTKPFLNVFEKLEARYKALQEHGYLVAYVVQKV